MAGWLQQLAHAPDGVAAIVAVLSAVAFWVGFSGMRRARHIEDVPTARVRSAPQGNIELIGHAHALDGEPIIAPLSNTRCCWFSFRVERRSGKDWSPVQSGSSDGIFLLRDATGDCVIDPEGAEVTSIHKRSWSDDGGRWGGVAVHARLPSLGKTADMVVDIGGKVFDTLGGGGAYRYTESVILEGDPLYAIGRFHSIGPGHASVTTRELTAAILREWKQQPDTLRERFDTNRDGVVDMDEWENARSVAQREAETEYTESLKRERLHTLRKPDDGSFFLIANLEEFGLLRRYRWRKRLGLGVFVLLALALFLMLSTRI